VRQDLGNEISLQIARQMLLQEQSVVVPGSLARRVSMQSCSATTQTALSLIEAGVGQAISVAELASRVGISRRELLRRFRRELDSTPSRVLANRRLDRARSLILNTRLGLAQIAESVGFSSQSHLTTNYRARFGITPARQRRENAAANDRLPLTRREARDW
jgi:transcriptional regulator GlxA family with amidase domain